MGKGLRSASVGGGVQNFSKADELGKLAELRDRELLTEKEYRAQRRELLGAGRPRARYSVFGICAVVVAAITAILAMDQGSGGHGSSAALRVQLASATAKENSAVGWAQARVGAGGWYGLCLSFVFDAYQDGAELNLRTLTSGVTYNADTDPEDVWGHFTSGLATSTTNQSGIPYGALVFFDAKAGYNPEDYSHVTIMGANNVMISTPDVANESVVHNETFAQITRAYSTYVGWWLPDGSQPAAAPPPAAPPATAAPSHPPTAASSPVPTSAGSGGSAPASPSGGSSSPPAIVMPAGSSPAPASSPPTTLSSAGGGSGTSSPPAMSAPSPSPPPAPTTYAETAGGVAHTWSNYTNAGGNEGPSVAGGQTVQIACKLPGFAVADGNTWWYRIAQSPWNNDYYVSADAFYNDGSTSGSLHSTPFVDSNVPNC